MKKGDAMRFIDADRKRDPGGQFNFTFLACIAMPVKTNGREESAAPAIVRPVIMGELPDAANYSDAN